LPPCHAESFLFCPYRSAGYDRLEFNTSALPITTKPRKTQYMDSINQQQPEENKKNLLGSEAGRKIKELAEKAKSCFFCTAITTGQAIKTRPMAVQKVDGNGNLYFLSANDSHKNAEIAQGNQVQLLFQGGAHSDFLSIYGTAAISTDKALIDELWEPILKTWFTEGKDDPRITVLIVDAQEGYYWDNKHGNAVAFAKMLAGAAMGKTLDDSIEGTLQV
jgi:general stress protein 26